MIRAPNAAPEVTSQAARTGPENEEMSDQLDRPLIAPRALTCGFTQVRCTIAPEKSATRTVRDPLCRSYQRSGPGGGGPAPSPGDARTTCPETGHPRPGPQGARAAGGTGRTSHARERPRASSCPHGTRRTRPDRSPGRTELHPPRPARRGQPRSRRPSIVDRGSGTGSDRDAAPRAPTRGERGYSCASTRSSMPRGDLPAPSGSRIAAQPERSRAATEGRSERTRVGDVGPRDALSPTEGRRRRLGTTGTRPRWVVCQPGAAYPGKRNSPGGDLRG